MEKKSVLSRFRGREIGVLTGLILLIIVFSLANHRFASLDNVLNILRQVSVVGIMALGMTCVIVCGDIDLSVGATYGMAAMLSGTLMLKGIHCMAAVGIGLLTGLLIGLLNGLVVTVLRVPAMIATLGMQYIARGCALIVTEGGVVNLMTPKASETNPSIASFLSFGSGKVFGMIPNMAIVFIAVVIIMAFVFHKTILGFKMRAVGGNANAAVVSGINQRAMRIVALMIMGFLSAFAGMLNFAFLNSVQGTMGEGIEMDVIAAAIIGGASLSGGEGTIVGTVIGVLIMYVLKTGLIYIGASAYLQMVFIGVVIIIAVVIDVLTKINRE